MEPGPESDLIEWVGAKITSRFGYEISIRQKVQQNMFEKEAAIESKSIIDISIRCMYVHIQ